MTATSVLTLTVYLAIMVIVATAAVGIRSQWRELPPAPPPPVPVPVRQKGTSAARGRHPFAHGPGRLARYAWRMSRVLARRTGEASVAAVRATPELPAHAARLGRHVAVRAEVGREAFDHGAARRAYRLVHPVLLRLVPLREGTGRLVLALLGPLRDLADRAATAGRNAGTGTGSGPGAGDPGARSDVDTWQLRVAAIRRRAAQWRVPRPRRAGDLDPTATADPAAGAPTAGDPVAGAVAAGTADDAAPAGTPDQVLAPLETGADVGSTADEQVLGDWSGPAADQVSASAPPTVSPTAPSPALPPSPAVPSTPASTPAATSSATVQREAPAEPRPTPSAAALSAARLALAGIHRDHAARHQAAARQAARHHGQQHAQQDGEHGPDLDGEDRVIDLTAVEAEVEAR